MLLAMLLLATCLGCQDSASSISDSVAILPVEPRDYSPEQIDLARNQAEYAAFRDADVVLIGKARFELREVLESWPAHYVYRVTIKPRIAHVGRVPDVRSFVAEAWLTSKEEPDVPEGQDCLIALTGDAYGESSVQWFKTLEQVSEIDEQQPISRVDLFRVAVLDRESESNDRLKLAQANPKEHPFYRPMAEAEGLAVLSSSGDPDSTVSFVAETSRKIATYRLDVNFKGAGVEGKEREFELESDAVTASRGHRFFATYRAEGDAMIVMEAWPVNEESLAIVASVLQIDIEALQQRLAK